MKTNLILIGFMGAGKTRIGTQYAKKHHMTLLDTDQLIEAATGMAISKIFETQGEEAFRTAETAVLTTLLNETEDVVISVGGGLPLREENRRTLKQLGTIVFLRVTRASVVNRLQGDKSRPLLQGGNTEIKVEELLAYRNPIYERVAHVVIDVDNKTPEKIVTEIEEKVGILE